jgi:septal ring factor EnvC (AmiA/AmiB activator)
MRKRSRPAIVLMAAIAAIVLTVPGAAGAAGPDTTREELSDVQRSLAGVRSELAGARTDAATLARALADANRTLAAAERELAGAQSAWVEARRRSVAATEALSQATAQVLRSQGIRDQQARSSYMTGGLLTEINVLLEARNLADFSARAVSVQRAAEDRNETLAELRVAEVAADRARTRMEAAEHVARQRRAEVEQKVAALAEVQAVRAEAKRRLDTQVAKLAAREASLTGRSNQLLAEIRAEEAAARRRAAAAAARRAAQLRGAEAAGAIRAGQVRASGGYCDLSSTSSAERWIIMHESSGRPDADNPTSTAFGLGQLLLSNRLHYLGADYATTDCGKQLSAFRAYVADAYGTAEAAQAFWQANGWY